MGTKHNDRCLDKAADDEPIFVLRAQDKLAPALVRQWALQMAGHATMRGANAADVASKYAEAMALADRMEALSNRKMPD